MQNIKIIGLDQLLSTVKDYFDKGYRFVTIDCVQIDDENFDMLYHFDKDFTLEHFRLKINKSETIPSISPVYFCGLVVENEIQDMFGVKFSNLVVDFQGRLLLTDHYAEPPQVISSLVVSVADKNKPAEFGEAAATNTEGGATNE